MHAREKREKQLVIIFFDQFDCESELNKWTYHKNNRWIEAYLQQIVSDDDEVYLNWLTVSHPFFAHFNN